jgi:hypothetical protein
MMNRVCQYSLKLLTTSISAEFIDRKNLRKPIGFVELYIFHSSENERGRNTITFSSGCHTEFVSKKTYAVPCKALRGTTTFGYQRKRFIEMLITTVTMISTLFICKNCLFSKDGYVLNAGNSVIMYLACK